MAKIYHWIWLKFVKKKEKRLFWNVFIIPLDSNNIKHQATCTFATETGTKSLKTSDMKTTSTSLIRDLWDSSLFLSLERQVDMTKVLSYPLTPVPLSFDTLCWRNNGKHQNSSLPSAPEKNVVKITPVNLIPSFLLTFSKLFFKTFEKRLVLSLCWFGPQQ